MAHNHARIQMRYRGVFFVVTLGQLAPVAVCPGRAALNQPPAAPQPPDKFDDLLIKLL